MINNLAVVTLWVDDFKCAISFYRDVLGLELTTRPGEAPHFRVGNGLLVLIKGQFCPPEDAFPPDFAQISFGVQNLEGMVANLQQHKVELIGYIEERRDSRWIKLRDPAGNLIELVEIKD
jgi:catechol 2,3-dioxygenase-like lactoylglutathione lyase family enzyme